MTTASRPTFDPARGGQGRGEKDLSAISRQYSSRDLPSHTKLKYREPGQGTIDEYRNRDFQRELEDKELRAIQRSSKTETENDSSSKRLRIEAGSSQIPSNLDADDPIINDDGADDNDSENSDSDEDDTAALLAELNQIKKERAIEQARKEAEQRQEEERIRMENIISGNPLLTQYSSGGHQVDQKVKRRWDDDVVFKNCARSEPEKKSNVFINDSLRSEFHKKFMEKYIK